MFKTAKNKKAEVIASSKGFFKNGKGKWNVSFFVKAVKSGKVSKDNRLKKNLSASNLKKMLILKKKDINIK